MDFSSVIFFICLLYKDLFFILWMHTTQWTLSPPLLYSTTAKTSRFESETGLEQYIHLICVQIINVRVYVLTLIQ